MQYSISFFIKLHHALFYNLQLAWVGTNPYSKVVYVKVGSYSGDHCLRSPLVCYHNDISMQALIQKI